MGNVDHIPVFTDNDVELMPNDSRQASPKIHSTNIAIIAHNIRLSFILSDGKQIGKATT